MASVRSEREAEKSKERREGKERKRRQPDGGVYRRSSWKGVVAGGGREGRETKDWCVRRRKGAKKGVPIIKIRYGGRSRMKNIFKKMDK